MNEIARFLQLRPVQKLAEEQKLSLGLHLYPDNKLSALAVGLTNAVGDATKYDAVINRYKETESGKKRVAQLHQLHPVIKALYEWFEFKSRPIKIKELQNFVQTLNTDSSLRWEEQWSAYADSMLIAIHNGELHTNAVIDHQQLIRICYLMKNYGNGAQNQYTLKAEEKLVNEILNAPVILPARILNTSDSEPSVVETDPRPQMQYRTLEGASIAFVRNALPCNCTCDETCKPPSRHRLPVKTYIADLFIIKEELARYEEGDIADIENILAGEKKLRKHRTLSRTEDTSETESETIGSEERDHQVSEKFTLQAEVKNTVDSKVNLDAGVTATLKYGDAITLTPHANVAANFSKSQSENIARSYSKDIVDRSVTKLQEKIRKLNTRKLINETEERNKHLIENTAENATHRAGLYYWVNKITYAQVFNRGKHMMFDLIVPEPAATFKKLYRLNLETDKKNNAPEKPCIRSAEGDTPLTPQLINRNNYGELLNRYNVCVTNDENIQPPAETTCVQIAFAKDISQPENKAVGFSSNEFKTEVPKGYQAHMMSYEIAASTGDAQNTECNDEVAVMVSVANTIVLRSTLNEKAANQYIPAQNWYTGPQKLPMNGEEGTVSIAIAGFSTLGLSVCGTVSMTCKLKDEAYENWKLKIYNLIMSDYNRRTAVAQNDNETPCTQIKGRNPFLNREIERNEFKRHIIAALMRNYFNDMGSMNENVSPCGYPEIDFQKLEKDACLIQFFEQVFEWNYMMYLFYHSMWARKCKWPDLTESDSGDPLFDKFLTAGASRVQIPIRTGMEEIFYWFLKTGQIWGNSGQPPVMGDDDYISMIQELKESKQCDYTDRPGFIEATQGSDVLKLTNSNFYWDIINKKPHTLNIENDLNREILINYEVYRMVKIEEKTPAATDHSAWEITVHKKYAGSSTKNLTHAIGAVFVGAPWEIVIPTKLVYLRNPNDKLPVYPLA